MNSNALYELDIRSSEREIKKFHDLLLKRKLEQSGRHTLFFVRLCWHEFKGMCAHEHMLLRQVLCINSKECVRKRAKGSGESQCSHISHSNYMQADLV
jgi:hypothetical protein